MKKLLFTIILVLGLVIDINATDWNIPEDRYNCTITALADDKWEPILIFTKEQRVGYRFGFILGDRSIIDGDGVVYSYQSTTKDGVEVFINRDITNALYIPTDSFTDGRYFLGLGVINNNGVSRFIVSCANY